MQPVAGKHFFSSSNQSEVNASEVGKQSSYVSLVLHVFNKFKSIIDNHIALNVSKGLQDLHSNSNPRKENLL